MLAQLGNSETTLYPNYSTVTEWFGYGVVETKTKSYITYEIDFLEILLDWKEKNERWKVRKRISWGKVWFLLGCLW